MVGSRNSPHRRHLKFPERRTKRARLAEGSRPPPVYCARIQAAATRDIKIALKKVLKKLKPNTESEDAKYTFCKRMGNATEAMNIPVREAKTDMVSNIAVITVSIMFGTLILIAAASETVPYTG
ncbi:hypothetical protein AAG570_011606 [Ranatra chinensis]|uniref:PGG domain-containing protein n=1 Tax=Ranatra chinensis TaxID=642074 RepID=A0ABD0YL49_9HEMI